MMLSLEDKGRIMFLIMCKRLTVKPLLKKSA